MSINDLSFYDRVIKPGEDFDAHIAEVGGLPELEAAAEGLRSALEQTRQEIETAEFASRFSREFTEEHRNRAITSNTELHPIARFVLEEGGTAELKRYSLRAELTTVERELAIVVDRLVRLRADLKISQMPFDGEAPAEADEAPKTE